MGGGCGEGARIHRYTTSKQTGGRAKAWCLLIHAEASLSPLSMGKQCGAERRALRRGDILRQILRALYPKLINPELVSEAGPH